MYIIQNYDYSSTCKWKVDTVQNPEPNGLYLESKFNYFLILCDRYSRIFRTIGMSDKTLEAYIGGIEQLISNFSTFDKNLKKISHVRLDAWLEFRSNTFRKWFIENNINFDTAAPKHQEQNGLVKRHWDTIVIFANTLLVQYRNDMIPVRYPDDEKGLK